MIPQIIHYCWFGGNPLPKKALKCIASWKKACPDYKIVEWNEENFDLTTCPLYVRQAYDAKKWAFVTDYVRLKLVYEHGGIYLDTDVELIKNLDQLLQYEAYFGFETKEYIATGLGFGAVPHCEVLIDMMRDYDEIPFVLEDGSFNILPCPQRNTAALIARGLVQDGSVQLLEGNIRILSPEYLCPLNYVNGIMRRTPNTISIHWYAATWHTEEENRIHRMLVRKYRWRRWRKKILQLTGLIFRKLTGGKTE